MLRHRLLRGLVTGERQVAPKQRGGDLLTARSAHAERSVAAKRAVRDGSGGGARGDTGDHRSHRGGFRHAVGWLGAGLAETWNTLDYLAEAGIRYVCDWVNDDQPYLFEIGTPPLVSLPYSVQTNDVPAYFEMKVSVPEFEAMLKRQFDTLYREGQTVPRVMAIAVHPFVTGQPHRIGALDAALEYICSHDYVWRATVGKSRRIFWHIKSSSRAKDRCAAGVHLFFPEQYDLDRSTPAARAAFIARGARIARIFLDDHGLFDFTDSGLHGGCCTPRAVLR